MAPPRSCCSRSRISYFAHWLGDVLRFSGRVEESLEPPARVLELDPFSGVGLSGQMQTFMMLGRWPEARQAAERLRASGYRELGSRLNMLPAGRQLGFTADELTSFAVEWATGRGYSRPEESAVIGRAILAPSLRPAARQVLERMADEGVNAANVAELFLAMGDPEAALTNLERVLAEHEPAMLMIGTDWIFDPLRNDPLFVRIIQTLGLPNGR